MLDGIMYKKGFSSPLLKSVHNEEGEAILNEVHKGECGGHTGPRLIAHKMLRQGYYLQIMHQDA